MFVIIELAYFLSQCHGIVMMYKYPDWLLLPLVVMHQKLKCCQPNVWHFEDSMWLNYLFMLLLICQNKVGEYKI